MPFNIKDKHTRGSVKYEDCSGEHRKDEINTEIEGEVTETCIPSTPVMPTPISAS